jgi:hypothetical protein
MRHGQRNIREVSMTMKDSDNKEGDRNEVLTFRKEVGGGDYRVKITGRVDRPDFEEHRTGPMSPSTFAHLTEAIEDNDFYSYLKKDSQRSSFNGSLLTLVTVVDDQGSHDLVVEHGIPNQMRIINAIRQAQNEIHWENVDPK